jgi:hypothetical protein
MAKRKNGERDIKSVVQEFIASNRLDKGLDQVSVAQAWESVMGAPIVKYTTGVVLDRDTLYVSLSSSVLREELSYGKLKIIDLLNGKMQKEVVRKLVLR